MPYQTAGAKQAKVWVRAVAKTFEESAPEPSAHSAPHSFPGLYLLMVWNTAQQLGFMHGEIANDSFSCTKPDCWVIAT